MKEKQIETALMRAVVKAGGLTRKWSSPARRGVPDQLVLIGGHVVGVEVKAPGKKPTAQQEREHDRLRQHGLPVYVVASLEDVELLVERFA
jgi:hypothetical protein